MFEEQSEKIKLILYTFIMLKTWLNATAGSHLDEN